MNFSKTVRIGTTSIGRRNASVYCKITFKDGKLSITGVGGPLPSGNALGGCGQIDMHLKPSDIVNWAPGWNAGKMKRFLEVWKRWHLNDMVPGTPAQMEFVRKLPEGQRDYGNAADALANAGLSPDPENGYQYGSAWLTEEVPEDVLQFLVSLPHTDKQPAWV